MDSAAERSGAAVSPGPPLVLLVCANCARPGAVPSASRPRPRLPDFDWPIAIEQIAVPCAGRVQPEYLLKAIEKGAKAVCVVACARDNCHNLEGCARAIRRVAYTRGLLAQAGLEPGRAMIVHLPGSARQDMELAETGEATGPSIPPAALAESIRAVRDQVLAAVDALPANPLFDHRASAGVAETGDAAD